MVAVREMHLEEADEVQGLHVTLFSDVFCDVLGSPNFLVFR